MKTWMLLAAAVCLAAPAYAAEDGAAVWKSKCKSCHGDDGKGETEMGKKIKAGGGQLPDMSDPKWHADPKHTDAWMKDVIANGVKRDGKDTKMKAFKDKLSPEQIDAVVAYVHTLKK